MTDQTTTHDDGSLSVAQWRRELCCATGFELRAVREDLGWSRDYVAQRLPDQLGERTILSYEHGTRVMSLTRFVEYSQTLDVDPPALLSFALGRIGSVTAFTLRVYTEDIALDLTPEFDKAQSWARRRACQYPNEAVVDLNPTAVRELAVVFEYDFVELSRYFYRFSDRNVDLRTRRPLNRTPARLTRSWEASLAHRQR